ncbi:MAG: hypothetical protein INQ03_18250 [Candidatus Heimdallarchaeota archaeon]|nr:hypothetical protein [Candidatus Heimdallarchaeota archaeon]
MKAHRQRNSFQKIRGLLTMFIFIIIIFIETYFIIIEPIQNGIDLQSSPSQYWGLAIPVYLMVSILSAITAWIGFTMYRTPEPIKLTYEEAYQVALEDQQEAEEESS